jgi:hypothetical protein
MFTDSRSLRFSPALQIPQRLDPVAQVSELRRRWFVHRIGAAPERSDKLRAMPAIASQLEPLAIDQALFQARPHQAAVMGNTVECAEFIGAHLVTRSQVTAEMLEALTTAGA